MTNGPKLIVIAALATQAACVPVIGTKWLAQPVAGTVEDGSSGQPVSGATVSGLTRRGVEATSDDNGEFWIPGVSSKGLHFRMAASYLDRQLWQVTHPDFSPAIIVTATPAPGYSKHVSTPRVPMFADLPAAPAECPFGPYLVRLYGWQETQPLLLRYTKAPEPDIVSCTDQQWRERVEAAYMQLLDKAASAPPLF